MEENNIESYKDSIVWQKAMDLVLVIYQLTESFPKSKMNELTAQMTKSAVAIPLNIAEGQRQNSEKDSYQSLEIAYRSGAQLETQIEVAKRLPFTKKLDFSKTDVLLSEIMKMLNNILLSPESK